MGIHKAMLGFALAVLMAGHLAVGATVLGQHQSTQILDGGRSTAHGPPETALPFQDTRAVPHSHSVSPLKFYSVFFFNLIF